MPVVGSSEACGGPSYGSGLAGVCAQTETLKGLWEGGWHSGRAGGERRALPNTPSILLRCQQVHTLVVRTTP